MEEILFLPPIYFLPLVVSAVTAGLLFVGLSQRGYIVAAGLLFGIFTISQLIFRILLHEQPERLVGQLIYFLSFLAIVYITREVRDRIIG